MRVGSALRYCLNGCLLAMGFTGSYSTSTVIYTLAAPPNLINGLWSFWAQSTLAQESAWSRSGTALKRGRYLIWQKWLTGAPMGWPGSQYRFGIRHVRLVRISAISFNSKSCGVGRFVSRGCGSIRCNAVECNAGGGVGYCFDFAAISWISRLIICKAR